jgi:ABC-2 type transport system permease protein
MRRAADAPSSTPPRAPQAASARKSSWERNGLRAGLSGLHEALQAEWTKLRTLSGTFWLLAAVVVMTVAVSAAAAAAVTCPHGGCSVDPARTSLTGIYLGQAVAAILGVLAIAASTATG